MLRFDPFSDLDVVTRGLLASQTGSNRAPPVHADGPLQDR